MDEEFEDEEQKVDPKRRHLDALKSRRTEEQLLILLRKQFKILKEELDG